MTSLDDLEDMTIRNYHVGMRISDETNPLHCQYCGNALSVNHEEYREERGGIVINRKSICWNCGLEAYMTMTMNWDRWNGPGWKVI